MLKTFVCGWSIILLWRDHLFQEISAHTRYVGACFIYIGLWVHIPVAIQYLLGSSSRKQQPPANQVKEQAPQAKDVRFVAEYSATEDIWVHIARCAAFYKDTFLVGCPTCEPKISETYLKLFLIKDQNVLRLDVSVHYRLAVHEVNSEKKLLHDLSDLRLRDHLLMIDNEVPQAAIFGIFQD